MRILQLDAADNNWQTLRFADRTPPDRTPWNSIENEPLSSAWTPPQMKPRDPKLPQSDFPMYLGRVLIISTKAYDLLVKEIAPMCEFLPIDCQGPSYIGVNVLREVNALDRETSKIDWMSKAKGIASKILKFDFHADMLSAELIFRIPELRFHLFVTDRFAEMLYDRGLRGFSLQQVWSDE